MTQMSDLHQTHPRKVHAKCANAKGQSPLARPLHISEMLVAPILFMRLTGCLLPPTLGVETQDAGINSPPAITSVRIDLGEVTEPGPISVGATPGKLNLKVIDSDLTDTVFPKIFVDYDYPDPTPTPARSTCTPGSAGTAERTSTCDLAGVCSPAEKTGVHLVSIVVFDRQVLDSGTPLYKATPPGTMSTSQTFLLKCL